MNIAGINSNQVSYGKAPQLRTNEAGKPHSPSGAEKEVAVEDSVDIQKPRKAWRRLGAGLTGAAVAGTLAAFGAVTGGTALALGALPLLGVIASDARTRGNKLYTEQKELNELKAGGQMMKQSPVLQSDMSFKEAKIPVNTLLKENQKAQNWNTLDAVASTSAVTALGVSWLAGLSAGAPIMLIPLALGSALFPKIPKALAKHLGGVVSGTLGQAGRSRRAAARQTRNDAARFSDQLGETLKDLKASKPQLFDARPKRLPFGEFKYGGYYTEMEELAKDYAASDSLGERQGYAQLIESAMSKAPDNAKTGVTGYRKEFEALSKKVEATWLERDVSLEMKTNLTKSVVNDDRVLARVEELGFSTDSISQQYEESLLLENSTEKLGEHLQASRDGSREATKKLVRSEIFKSARVLSMLETELGKTQYDRVIGAINTPEDVANLEVVLQEVGYERRVPMTKDELTGISAALKNLNTPIDIGT